MMQVLIYVVLAFWFIGGSIMIFNEHTTLKPENIGDLLRLMVCIAGLPLACIVMTAFLITVGFEQLQKHVAPIRIRKVKTLQ